MQHYIVFNVMKEQIVSATFLIINQDAVNDFPSLYERKHVIVNSFTLVAFTQQYGQGYLNHLRMFISGHANNGELVIFEINSGLIKLLFDEGLFVLCNKTGYRNTRRDVCCSFYLERHPLTELQSDYCAKLEEYVDVFSYSKDNFLSSSMSNK